MEAPLIPDSGTPVTTKQLITWLSLAIMLVGFLLTGVMYCVSIRSDLTVVQNTLAIYRSERDERRAIVDREISDANAKIDRVSSDSTNREATLSQNQNDTNTKLAGMSAKLDMLVDLARATERKLDTVPAKEGSN